MSSKSKKNKSNPKYEDQKNYFCVKCEEYVDLFDNGIVYYESDDEYMCEDCAVEILTQEDEEDYKKVQKHNETDDEEEE